MKKVKKIAIILMILFWCCFSQVHATELTIDSNVNEIQTSTDLKDAVKRSTYNALLSKETALESSYHLKDHIPNIRIKNQKGSSACWAFSFSSILETSIAKQQNKASKEYSPMHIEYVTTQMFNRTLGSGAGPRLSTAYSLSGHGPVEESQMPFASVYSDTTKYKDIASVGSLDKTIAARIKEVAEFPSIYKKMEDGKIQYFSDSSCTKSYTAEEVKATRELVKQHIKTYGAVSADMYMDEANYYKTSIAAYNYNNYQNRQQPNHVVSIVGWDDNYSIDQFKTDVKPSEKGAYIALNSYGTQWGDGGYMYISYEDACMEECLMGIKQIEEYKNQEKDYDKIYQYDELGMNTGIPLGGQTAYVANKYTREKVTNQEEYIQEVGLYIASTSGVEVFINPDSDEIEKAKLVAQPLEALETGYHTVKFAEPVKLTGDKFVIKVKYTNQEGAYIPMEVNYKTFGLAGTSDFFDKATAKDEECYISKDGLQWEDVNKTVLHSGGKQYSLANSSTCIKAFTTYQTKASEDESEKKPDVSKKAVEKITLNQTSLEVQKGDQFNLVVTFSPSDATNKNLKWKTSDEKIATVTATGVITAISEGKVIITAISEDGNKTASCVVTVKAKTNTENDIYKDSNEIKYDNNSSSNQNNNNSNNNSNNSNYNNANNKGNSGNINIQTYHASSQDSTIANKIIPFAGNSFFVIIAMILIMIVGGIAFFKMKVLKDVK